jgi:hypothetical protein
MPLVEDNTIDTNWRCVVILPLVARQIARVMPRGAGVVKSFEHELARAGGVACRVDLGMRTVPTDRIVGSLSRWNHLRGDFLDKNYPEINERHRRIRQAMVRGTTLPAVELYELRVRPTRGPPAEAEAMSEYYVVDGHHRVAMARRLRIDFLDAHVILYRAAGPQVSELSTSSSADEPAEGEVEGDAPDLW